MKTTFATLAMLAALAAAVTVTAAAAPPIERQAALVIGNASYRVGAHNNPGNDAQAVAGALRDHKRATLIGTRTCGKGSVQAIIPLGTGNGALALATG